MAKGPVASSGLELRGAANSRARLPYQKNVLETLATVVVAAIVDASNVEMRDVGQGVQIHDFDVVITLAGRVRSR